MNVMRVGSAVLGLLCVLATGCQNKLHDENKALWAQNRELEARNRAMGEQLRSAPDPAQIQSMQQEIAARDAKIAELENQLKTPAPGQAQDNLLAGIEVTRDERAGTMTVNLPGDVLFPSGQAVLKDSAKATLNKVASAVKKDYSGKKIYVEGHTDTDPISKTKDKWQDNLDLSAERARVVREYLISQGIDAKLIGTRAYGETMPKGSKAASRRVEIVVATR